MLASVPIPRTCLNSRPETVFREIEIGNQRVRLMLTAKLYHLHWVPTPRRSEIPALTESLLKSLTSLALTCYYQDTVHSVYLGGRRITVVKSNYYKNTVLLSFSKYFFKKICRNSFGPRFLFLAYRN
jgi:hypothetical protein